MKTDKKVKWHIMVRSKEGYDFVSLGYCNCLGRQKCSERFNEYVLLWWKDRTQTIFLGPACPAKSNFIVILICPKQYLFTREKSENKQKRNETKET